MSDIIELQEQYRRYRDALYQEYPRVERFERAKRRWLLLLLLLCGTVHLIELCRVMGNPAASVGYECLKAFSAMGTEWIFLLAAMGDKWRLGLMLYLLSVYHLIFLGGKGVFLPEVLSQLTSAGFGEEPLIAASVMCTFLYVLLTLAAAFWLTGISKNRRLAEQEEELHLKMREFAKEHPVR